jgi:DNA polymerase III gamma/tau subunit
MLETEKAKSTQIALYRKYRPKTFKDVLGQEHIVRVLENSVKLGNISHAYIFTGTRGTGKTSVARIFAQAVGCSANDLYEIDAASNNGVDEVRILNEGVNTLPFESPYKVYILDEAHMLSKAAFNALLKTLEEPPAYVIFILATTELEKLPETVVSRCQTFHFKKPGQQLLKDAVMNIAKQEGFVLEPSSAELIALLGDGSFRDTEGILDKVLSSYSGGEKRGDDYTDGKGRRHDGKDENKHGNKQEGKHREKIISAEEVEMVTGAPKSELVNRLIESLDQGHLDKGLLIISEASKNNIDMKTYIKLILHKIRFVLLLRFSKDLEKTIAEEVSSSDFTFLKTMSENKESKISSRTLVELLTASDQVSRAVIEELPLELALVRLAGDRAGA